MFEVCVEVVEFTYSLCNKVLRLTRIDWFPFGSINGVSLKKKK